MSETKGARAVPPQDIIALAEKKYYIGRFIVDLKNAHPHPHQRLVDENWVSSLLEEFHRGLDRAAHPIKVLLADDEWEKYVCTVHPNSAFTVPRLASGLQLLVYHGQHRVQACKRLASEDEHWWFADIYSGNLEKHHPAEFVSLMHAGNDSPKRLESRDVDRFLGILQLLRLKDQGQISSETFYANRDRLAGQHESKFGSRQCYRLGHAASSASPNIPRSLLAEAYQGSLLSGKQPFNGILLKLVADLISEMEQQFLLLRDSSNSVSPKPFQLAAKACSWESLKRNVKARDHPWHELSGGSTASLKRVQNRPAVFKTKLNPEGDWTFPDMVLMPSVLTSQVVTEALESMYHLAQHLVHMIGGPEVLESYTSNVITEKVPQDPVGIIAMVAGDRMVMANGQTSGFPHKVVRMMWCSRTELMQELLVQGIADAERTSCVDYQRLIEQCGSWWSLTRLFKIKKFTTGLRLTVPNQLGADAKSTEATNQSLPSGQDPRFVWAPQFEPAILLQTGPSSSPKTVEHHGGDTLADEHLQSTSQSAKPVEMDVLPIDVHTGNPTTSPSPANGNQQSSSSKRTTSTRKRPRIASDSPDGGFYTGSGSEEPAHQMSSNEEAR
ncbi:hypothetical protein FRC07_012665, partial [Ceratobasidium sp. 392]